MKIIGTSENQGIIVEFTKGEYDELEKLCQAVEGKTVNDVLMQPPRDVYAFSYLFSLHTVFRAVRAFTNAKFQVNEMRLLVNNLDQIVSGDFNVSDS